jgi:pyruvate dehydrogenase E1 component alpha subunit
MSDPAKYRSKDEVEEYKEKDPITEVLKVIETNAWATEAEIEAINEKVRLQVEECVQFAEDSPWPDDSELYKDIYVDENYPYITD